MKYFQVFAVLLLTIAYVYGQGDTGAPAEIVVESPKSLAHPDVSTSFTFPKYPTKEVEIGKKIELLVGIHNKAKEPLNVTQIGVSLLHPQDYRVSIQNFTKISYNTVVAPSEQATFLYTFTADPLLEPRVFGLAGSVVYELENSNFTTVFLNASIPFIEPESALDAETLFTYVGIIGIFGLVAFIVYTKFISGSKRFKKSSQRVEYGTQKRTTVDNDWLEGTAAARHLRSPKSPRSKPKKS